MITVIFWYLFYKSGEFDEKRNRYAGMEILTRVPFFFVNGPTVGIQDMGIF